MMEDQPKKKAPAIEAEAERVTLSDNSNIVTHPAAFVKTLIYSAGTKNTRFSRTVLPYAPSLVESFALALEQIPSDRPEAWWTPHIWAGDRRSAKAWMGSHAIAVDVDYEDSSGVHTFVPEAMTEVSLAQFSANLSHWTPRGFRLIYVFDVPWTRSKGGYDELAKVVTSMVLGSMDSVPVPEGFHFSVDNKVQVDGGRILYAPKAFVNGIQRTGDVQRHRGEPYSFDELAFRSHRVQTLSEEWNKANEHLCEDWPESNGECPACGHTGCFGYTQDDPLRWFCFSANHEVDAPKCGVPCPNGAWGSALDLEAHRRGCSRVEVLDLDGYFLAKKEILSSAKEAKVRQFREEILSDPLFEVMLENIVQIQDSSNVIDSRTAHIFGVEACRNTYPRYFKEWQTHPDRRVLPLDDVVFAPEGALPSQLNLYRGLPLTPAVGDCGAIVEHVYNMCDYDEALAHHLLCWLAWPLKHPGAKMGYSVVVHGGQGTGKSLFFERLMMEIYGLKHSIQIGQTELESSFTGWLSQKLYVVCNEVSSTAKERTHSRNRLKSLITDKHFAIDEKYQPLRTEENHANLIFLSNEHQPVLPEMDDRRYEIIRFDRKESAEYYDRLAECIREGASAFYQFLLDYDTLDYCGTAEKPLSTFAKEVLIATSRTPPEQFLVEWKAGDTSYPYSSCGVDDLWLAYRLWCREAGYYTGTKNSFGRTLTLSPLGRDLSTSTTLVDGKNTRFRKTPDSDQTAYSDQIKLFREEYNNAYVNYRTRTQI